VSVLFTLNVRQLTFQGGVEFSWGWTFQLRGWHKVIHVGPMFIEYYDWTRDR
jgi:hypothetical protein